ncbi:hypothetical protein Tco_0656351 [Tanacetum coccineum]|uniref:Uncharacterized protein n=1 Tax=Tanacetum coccineum TaxID=301880 RepID=A0ABQ4X8X6_9ASTR
MKFICNLESKEGLPLYTPFYYSPEEIKYFSPDSRFSDEEETEVLEEVTKEQLNMSPHTKRYKELKTKQKRWYEVAEVAANDWYDVAEVAANDWYEVAGGMSAGQ